ASLDPPGGVPRQTPSGVTQRPLDVLQVPRDVPADELIGEVEGVVQRLDVAGPALGHEAGEDGRGRLQALLAGLADAGFDVGGVDGVEARHQWILVPVFFISGAPNASASRRACSSRNARTPGAQLRSATSSCSAARLTAITAAAGSVGV